MILWFVLLILNSQTKVFDKMASFDNEVDLSALPANVPSLCIPRVFKNITRERVMACFKDLDIGFVERIDMVSRVAENGDQFQRVFVHLRWNNKDNSVKARTRVLSGKEIKIIYDEPWFWKVSANRSVSRDSNEKGRERVKATLDLDGEDDLETSVRKTKSFNDRDRKRREYKPSERDRRAPKNSNPRPRPRSPSVSPPSASLNDPGIAIDYGVAMTLSVPKRKKVVLKAEAEKEKEKEEGEDK